MSPVVTERVVKEKAKRYVVALLEKEKAGTNSFRSLIFLLSQLIDPISHSWFYQTRHGIPGNE